MTTGKARHYAALKMLPSKIQRRISETLCGLDIIRWRIRTLITYTLTSAVSWC